jgi:hypothetical protein
LEIELFLGSKPIDSLPFQPLVQISDNDSLRADLVNRGHRTCELNRGGYMAYTGLVRRDGIHLSTLGSRRTGERWVCGQRLHCSCVSSLTPARSKAASSLIQWAFPDTNGATPYAPSPIN